MEDLEKNMYRDPKAKSAKDLASSVLRGGSARTPRPRKLGVYVLTELVSRRCPKIASREGDGGSAVSPQKKPSTKDLTKPVFVSALLVGLGDALSQCPKSAKKESSV
jgi:hypothetical protein